jgi:hypothetical protein
MTAKSFDDIGRTIMDSRMSEYFRKKALFYSCYSSCVGAGTYDVNKVPKFSAFDDPEGYNELQQPYDDYLIDVLKRKKLYSYDVIFFVRMSLLSHFYVFNTLLYD